ncbi:CoA pyrophosphatase, partial [Serratia rubidaea]|nr:CoA pyrophosphatase [Serratia rubidaea]
MNPPIYPTTLADFVSRFQLQQPQAVQTSHGVRAAAVLVPIVCREEPT